jgi:predicted aconitase
MGSYGIELTDEERDTLDGKHGEVMAKAMLTIVKYGEVFGAKRLLPLDAPIHVVTSMGMTGLDAMFRMMDELIAAGIKVKRPFTADPKPYDFDALPYHEDIKKSLLELYANQDRYEAQLAKLGMKGDDYYSCTCYLPEVGNTPKKGDILSWAESSAAVYANSVLGARTNRNSGIIELLGGIVDRAPEFGYLTDEGRKATWLVELKSQALPNAMLLGSAIGLKVVGDVPFIAGLDRFLGTEITDSVRDYLKDMGAASASNGAVGMFYVEHLTPDAKDAGRGALKDGYQTYTIDDDVLAATMANYPILWKDPGIEATICVIGCPHLTLSQIHAASERISKALAEAGKEEVRMRTVLVASPLVIKKFKEDRSAFEQLTRIGLTLSHACPVMHMNSAVAADYPMMTSSNKLRTYSTARFFLDDELVKRLVVGIAGKASPGRDPHAPVGPISDHGIVAKPIAEHRVTK